MTIVDASALVVAIAGSGDRARIAEEALHDAALAAPAMVRVEATSAVRAMATSGEIDDTTATRRLGQLLAIPIALHPVEPHLPRIWELRHNVTPYDAWYVALGDALDAPLLTTDARLSRASGVRCAFWVV